jgi:hypothetical protein
MMMHDNDRRGSGNQVTDAGCVAVANALVGSGDLRKLDL